MKRVAAFLFGCAVAAAITGCQSTGEGQAAAGAGPAVQPDRVIDMRADAALRAMSQQLAGAQRLHFVADYTMDAPDEAGVLIQTARRSTLDLQRPNRMCGVSVGDDRDKEYWYDGKSVTVADKRTRTYSTVDTPDTIDAMLDFLHEHYGLSLPTADLLFSDPYATLTRSVQSGRYIGRHEVLGHPCHHLAFSQNAVDWQIWIEDSATPFPRKLVVAYKLLAGVPRFSATFDEWDTQRSLPEERFHFQPEAGMVKVDWEPVADKSSSSH